MRRLVQLVLCAIFVIAGGLYSCAQSIAPQDALQATQNGSQQAQNPSAEQRPGNDQQTASDQQPASDPESMFPHFSDTRYWLSGQANFIFQTHPPFHAPYSGANSLDITRLMSGEAFTSLLACNTL